MRMVVVESFEVVIKSRVTIVHIRTIDEDMRPVSDPSMVGSYLESSCRASIMILQDTIDRPAINKLELGKILGMQQGIPNGHVKRQGQPSRKA